MALHYELQRRRLEFTSASFDEMVEKIIDLESDLQDARDELRVAEETIAELEAAATAEA